MAFTRLEKKAVAGWYLVSIEVEKIISTPTGKKPLRSRRIESFPAFIDGDCGVLVDSDNDAPFMMENGWEYLQFIPAQPGCFGYFMCCDACGMHQIIAVETTGVALDIDTQVLISDVASGKDECDVCEEQEYGESPLEGDGEDQPLEDKPGKDDAFESESKQPEDDDNLGDGI